MFSFGAKPQCPCYPLAKEWVEQRLGWIRGQFGTTIFDDRPLVFPTDDFFPDDYDGTDDAARAVLRRVANLMDVPSDRVALRIDDAGFPTDFGKRWTITIDRRELGRPHRLITIFASELAQGRLFVEDRADDAFDADLLTDLTASALGFALFLANAAQSLESSSFWPGTRLSRPASMTPPMFGWMLAHLAWFENDPKPGWEKYLGNTSKTDFREGVRYLFATGDTTFRPRAVSS
ncbi:MAG: hypothetical protein JOZ54_08180 [Acidobacteria bacterium]|nr:hypothetical protein [Acidobacteriota bacterium]